MDMDRPHRFDIRVYYEDTDFSGVVYHAGYLRFLERGRTEFLRSLGVSQATLFAKGATQPIAFAVTRMEIDFRRPAVMDDLMAVETELLDVGGASLRMRQRLLRKDDLLVEATVRIAAVSAGRVVRIPTALSSALSAVRGNFDLSTRG